MNPKMTLKECVDAMRDANIRCSESGVADAIELGIYRFGRIKHVGKTGRRTVEIWRVDFERWLADKVCAHESEKPRPMVTHRTRRGKKTKTSP